MSTSPFEKQFFAQTILLKTFKRKAHWIRTSSSGFVSAKPMTQSQRKGTDWRPTVPDMRAWLSVCEDWNGGWDKRRADWREICNVHFQLQWRVIAEDCNHAAKPWLLDHIIAAWFWGLSPATCPTKQLDTNCTHGTTLRRSWKRLQGTHAHHKRLVVLYFKKLSRWDMMKTFMRRCMQLICHSDGQVSRIVPNSAELCSSTAYRVVWTDGLYFRLKRKSL